MRERLIFLILLLISTLYAFEYGGQKFQAKDDNDDRDKEDSTETSDDLADAEDDDGPGTTTNRLLDDAASLRGHNARSYMKKLNASLLTKDIVPSSPDPAPALLKPKNASLLEVDIDDSLKVLNLDARKKSDVQTSKTISEELVDPPAMNLPMRPFNYTSATIAAIVPPLNLPSLNVKQTIGENRDHATARAGAYNLTAQLEKESTESNSANAEGSGSGDAHAATQASSDASGSGDGGANLVKTYSLDGTNVGRITKSYSSHDVVPIDITEKQQLTEKFASTNVAGSGEASGSGDVRSHHSAEQNYMKKDSLLATSNAIYQRQIEPASEDDGSASGTGNVRRSTIPKDGTFTVYNSHEQPDSHPSYYTSNVLRVNNFGRAENVEAEQPVVSRRSKVVADSEGSGSGRGVVPEDSETSGSGKHHQRSKVGEDEEEDDEDEGDEGEEEGDEEEEEEGEEEGEGDDDDDDDDDDHDDDRVHKHQVPSDSENSGSGETDRPSRISKHDGNSGSSNSRDLDDNHSGDSSGFSESGDFDATNGFSASGEPEADNYGGDVGPDYKAYNKRRNTATRRGIEDRTMFDELRARAPIVSYSTPRNDHVSYYKESPADDVIGMPDTREMGSVKATENQLNNVKNEKSGDVLTIVSATDDTAASGTDVKAEIDTPASNETKSDKENSTKRESGTTVSDALKDIGFTNKTHPANHDKNGFKNDTVHIYANKDGTVHNKTSHKQFQQQKGKVRNSTIQFNNAQETLKKIGQQVSAMKMLGKTKSKKNASISKDKKEAHLKKDEQKKESEPKNDSNAHATEGVKEENKTQSVDDNNEKSIASIEAELVDDSISNVNKNQVNETAKAEQKAVSDDKSGDGASDYIKDALSSKDSDANNEPSDNEKEKEDDNKVIASGNVVHINVNPGDKDENKEARSEARLSKTQLKNNSIHESIHVSIFPDGKIALHGGDANKYAHKTREMQNTSMMDKFEPHNSESPHIDIAKIKNEDGTTTEVQFYHNKSGLYESDKHYSDMDVMRNHSFYLSQNGTKQSNMSLYEYLHTNKWMMNETRRKNGPLSDSAYYYLDQSEGSNKTSDEIMKNLKLSKDFMEDSKNAENSTEFEGGMADEPNSMGNETESGQSLSATSSLVDAGQLKENNAVEGKAEVSNSENNTNNVEQANKSNDEQGNAANNSNGEQGNAANNSNGEQGNAANNSNGEQGNAANINNGNAANGNNNANTDPFTAMINSIGQETVSLKPSTVNNQNASVSNDDAETQGGSENNNNNNNTDANGTAHDATGANANGVAHDGAGTNVNGAAHNGAAINFDYDTQLALGDKMHDGTAVNNANLINNGTGNATSELKNSTLSPFQAGLETEGGGKNETTEVKDETESKPEHKKEGEGKAEVKDEGEGKHDKAEVKDETESKPEESKEENKTEIKDMTHLNKNPGPNFTDPMIEFHKILSENDTNDNTRYSSGNETELHDNSTVNSANGTDAALTGDGSNNATSNVLDSIINDLNGTNTEAQPVAKIDSQLNTQLGATPDAAPDATHQADQKPAGEQTGDQKPAGEQTGDQKPAGEQTGDQKPAGEQTGDQKPAGEQTGDQKPDAEQKSDQKPDDGPKMDHKLDLNMDLGGGDPLKPSSTQPSNASIIFNHMEPVNHTTESDIQYIQKPIEMKNKEQVSVTAPKNATKSKKKTKPGVDVKVYSSGVTNVYVDHKGNVDVRRVDKKNATVTTDSDTRKADNETKALLKQYAKNSKSSEGLEDDLMKEESGNEKDMSKKESVKTDKEAMNLNITTFEKAKIGQSADDFENDTNVFTDTKLFTKNSSHGAHALALKNATRKLGFKVKSFNTMSNNKVKSGNKTTSNVNFSRKNDSSSHHDVHDGPKMTTHNFKNGTSNKPSGNKIKLMSSKTADKILKKFSKSSEKNATAPTAKEKKGSALFSKHPKETSLLKTKGEKLGNSGKNNSAHNISASDVSRSALTIVEDLVDIINSTHGKNKKNGTNNITNEKIAKQKITRYTLRNSAMPKGTHWVAATPAQESQMASHSKRQSLLRHRRKKKGSAHHAYSPVSLVKRDAYEMSAPQDGEDTDEDAIQKRSNVPRVLQSHVSAPVVEEVESQEGPTPRNTIPASYGTVTSSQQGYVVEQKNEPVTIEEVDPVTLEAIRKSEIPDEYVAMNTVQPLQRASMEIKKSEIPSEYAPEVVEPMSTKKGEIPPDYVPEEIEPIGSFVKDEINAPEHVSAEAEHLQNIKKGEIASEYISDAVQPQTVESEFETNKDVEHARKHLRNRIPAKDRARKVKLQELAAAVDVAEGGNVERTDTNRQYLEKRDKIWTDDLEDIDGAERNIVDDSDDDRTTIHATADASLVKTDVEVPYQERSNIMNMLSSSETTMSSATNVVTEPQTSTLASGDEHMDAESGSGDNVAVTSGEDAGSAEPTDESSPSVNTKRDTIPKPQPLLIRVTSDIDYDDKSETTEISRRNDVEKERTDMDAVESGDAGSADASGSGVESESGAKDEGDVKKKKSSGARESIVKKLVNEMAHAAAGSVKEGSRATTGSTKETPRASTTGRSAVVAPAAVKESSAHVVVKKSNIVPKHELVKRSSLSEEEIVNLSNNKDIHTALKMLVSSLITKGPGNGPTNEHLLRVKRMETEEKLEKDLLARSSVPRNGSLSAKEKIVEGVRDFEGLGEELSQSDFLTPYKHDVIASKLEGDLLKNLKLNNEESATIYKEEDDLLKATEMEFIKDKIDREFGTNVGASRADKIDAIRSTIKSLPLSKEDSEDLTKSIQEANWLGVGSSSRKKKSKLKHPRQP